MIEKAIKENFTCTFEAQGYGLLFEDLIINYYYPPPVEVFSFWTNGLLQTYTAKAVLEKMREEGRGRTLGDTKEAIAALSNHTDLLLKDLLLYRTKEALTKSELKQALQGLGKAFTLYAYFDPFYWDAAYEIAGVDSVAQENIDLVQGYKNVVRKKFEPLCFDKDGYLYSILKILGGQFNLSFDNELDWYTELELQQLFDGVRVEGGAIAIRKEGYAFYISPSAPVQLAAGKKAKEVIAAFAEDLSQTSVDFVTGRVANRGVRIQAKVRIIRRDYSSRENTQKQIDAMRQGEVLVSETTDPELMGAFHKASAVVTDIGGLLSHAAITSRELNLPCVVSTSNATKVFKTGDLVEVDTEKGVVRILQRA